MLVWFSWVIHFLCFWIRGLVHFGGKTFRLANVGSHRHSSSFHLGKPRFWGFLFFMFSQTNAVLDASFAEHSFLSTESSDYCEFRSGNSFSAGQRCSRVFGGYDRIGEAAVPGPSSGLFRIGTSNPSGLRGKEPQALQLGCGIWSFSETQLSHVTQPRVSSTIKNLGKQHERMIRTIHGAPAPTRSNSQWAGSWTGVSVLSDVPAQQLALQCPGDEYNCGRLLASRHFFDFGAISIGTIYGFPRGPTWPNAGALNRALLDVLSCEIVQGMSGPRAIQGDFNMDSSAEIFQFWTRMGWQNLQDYAVSFLEWEKKPTSKKAKERDMIWCSPELLAMVRSVGIIEVFLDHDTLFADICIEQADKWIRSWPRPSSIPWQAVDPAWSSQSEAHLPDNVRDPDFLRQFGAALEKSLDGFVSDQPSLSLTNNQKGRAQRSQPTLRLTVPTTAKASRAREVQLRSNQVGNAVQRWFQQLRRLQSYWHASKSSSSSLHLLEHKVELWQSIKKARGFRDGFSKWWTVHHHELLNQGPAQLPQAPPNQETAQQLFLCFKEHFERFEAWHLQQRKKLLAAKHDKTLRQLHQDLKDPKKEQIDFLWNEVEYTVVDIDADQRTLVPDKPFEHEGDLWFLGGVSISIMVETPLMAKFGEGPTPKAGDTLTLRKVSSNTDEVHQDLIDLWKPRWQKIAEIPEAHWQRVTGFVRAFLPKMTLSLAPLTVQTWLHALGRYHEHSARGADGFSHLDLRNLPMAWTSKLVDWLNSIELGESVWPSSVLYGMIVSLAKTLDAHTAASFRPIAVFSIIYRTWASIRAKHLLTEIAEHVPSGLKGFVPGQEALQIWWQVQQQIEDHLRFKRPLAGASTDLVKAFNNIPRRHHGLLADHFGVDPRVMRPWQYFLDHCIRAFQVRDSLSLGLDSTHGLPEGDPLSTFGMVQINVAWHAYAKMLCPRVDTWSYVDNLALIAAAPFDVFAGFNALKEFLLLWGMQHDEGKTFAWGLDQSCRADLTRLGFRVSYAEADLGGSMTFVRNVRNKHLTQRMESLAPKWERLRLSAAPNEQKLAILPLTFWTKALHGLEACIFASGHLSKLRTKALQCLKIHRAGVNPMLRLSLSSNPQADPGFFQVIRTVSTFRRICAKDPHLITSWKQYMSCFAGDILPGPFSKLLVVLGQLHWSISPPTCITHHGLEIDLIGIDDQALVTLLHDGWLQFVAWQVRTRASMADLHGLDVSVLNFDKNHHDALDRSMIAALRSGAFLSPAAQSKFDVHKEGCCELCQVPDRQEHWLVCPRYAQVRASIQDWPTDIHTWPLALRAHLLPDRCHHRDEYLRALLAIPDGSGVFHSHPGAGRQHIFTDGSCMKDIDSSLTLCSWATLNATTRQIISSGTLPGLSQTIPRAELFALLSAVRWIAIHQIPADCWIDNKQVAQGAELVLQNGRVPPHWSNQDLWQRLKASLEQCIDLDIRFHWWPSHLAASCCTDGFHDWARHWNNAVDRQAVLANHQHSISLLQVRQQLRREIQIGSSRCRMLFAFYKKVASSRTELSSEAMPTSTPSTTERVSDFEGFSERMPVGWPLMLSHEPNFVKVLVDSLFSIEVHPEGLVFVSWIELAFILFRILDQPLPYWDSSQRQWILKPLQEHFVRPTLAFAVRQVRQGGSVFVKTFGCEDLRFQGCDKSCLGIHFLTDGILLGITEEMVQRVTSLVRDYTLSRPLRKACDLARPI